MGARSWPSFRDLSRLNRGVTNFNTFHLSSDRFATNRRWTSIWPVHVIFVWKRSDEKYNSVFLFCNGSYFHNTTSFWPKTSLWAAITSKRRPGHLKQLYFLNPAQVQSFIPKKSLFRQFPCPEGRKCCGLMCAQFLCDRPPTQDKVSDLRNNWVAQRRDFESALRIVKVVLNTKCYLYIWPTTRFHAKNPNKYPKNQNKQFY